MKRIGTAIVLFLLLTSSLYASGYDRILCPPVGGRFLLISGQLFLEITREHDKTIPARRERITNPLDERSHEVLAKRGTVTVEAHRDKKSGDLFIHWGTLKDAKP